MIELSIYRGKATPNSTPGTLWHGNTFLTFIIEDEFHAEKMKGKTRIPPGRYKCLKSTDTKFNAKYKQKYGHDWVMRILDVPNYSGIEIHILNKASETDGCPGPNSKLVYNPATNEFFGEGSRDAYI